MDTTLNLSANQRYKQYKRNGGTMSFANFINTEGINSTIITDNSSFLNNPINSTVMNKTVLGVPVKTLAIGAGVIVAGVIIYHMFKKK